MGFGLLAASVVAGGAAAYSANESNKAKKKQAGYADASNASAAGAAQRSADDQAHNNQLQGMWMSGMPSLDKLDLGSILPAFSEFLSQKKYVPELGVFAESVNAADNSAFQKRLESVAPGAMATLKNNAATVGAYSRGEIPQDVQDMIRRNAAQQALTGGFSPRGGASDTPMLRDLVARDFGRTSMDLKDKATSLFPSLIQSANAVNPSQISIGSLLFSPETLLQRRDSQTIANWQIQNQNKDRQWQAGYGQVLANMKVTPGYVNTTPTPYATSSPLAAGISAGVGTLAGGFQPGMFGTTAPSTGARGAAGTGFTNSAGVPQVGSPVSARPAQPSFWDTQFSGLMGGMKSFNG